MSTTVYGSSVSYDGGKFQLGVTYDFTASAITAEPFVKVTNDTTSQHAVTIWYKTSAGSSGEKKASFYTGGGYMETPYQLYPWNAAKLSLVAESVTFYAHLNANSNAKTTAGKKVSGTSSLTIKSSIAPTAPGGLDVDVINTQGQDNKLDVHVSTVHASSYKPVRYLQFSRLTQSRTSGSGWENVGARQDFVYLTGPVTYPPDNRLRIIDNGVSAGNRYLYRCTVTSPNGKSTSVQTPWVFTSPPPVSDVSHERIDDSKNRVYFTRSKLDVALYLIRGYRVQYNTKDPADSSFDTGWVDLPPSSYVNFDKNRRQRGGLMTQDYDDVAFDHIGCVRDGRYSYRIATYNHSRIDSNTRTQASAYVEFKGTTTTYNTPNKPASISGVADWEEDIRIVLWIHPSVLRENGTADVLYLQRKRSTTRKWTDLPLDGNKMIPLSTRWSDEGLEYKYKNDIGWVYEYEDTDVEDLIGLAGTDIQYRAAFGCTKTNQNGNPVEGNGKSEWSEIFSIQLLHVPNPPNLILPIKNSLVANDTDTVRLGWTHSPVDGTGQEDVVVQYKTPSDNTWRNVVVTDKTAAYVDLPIGEFSVNTEITWRVSTKGMHKDFSDFTESKFKLVSKPKISFYDMTDVVNVVHKLPLNIEWEYEDLSGSLDSLELEVYQGRDLLKQVTIPKDAENYELSDVFFYDDIPYVLKLRAVSTTRFSDEASVTVMMKYSDIRFLRGFDVVATFDEDTGYSIVKVEKLLPMDDELETNDESVETEDDIYSTALIKHFYLYRLYNDERTFIAEQEIDTANYDAVSTFEYIDKTEPINRDFDYRLVQVSEGDETGISKNNVYNFETIWWYIYFGTDNIIKTRWNPTSSVSLGRPERQEVRYSGRTYPVIYDSLAMEETFNYNFILLRQLEYYEEGEDNPFQVLNKFKQLMKSGGVGFWKSFEGDVYDAQFNFSYSSDYKEGVPLWDCSLDVSRIEGDE